MDELEIPLHVPTEFFRDGCFDAWEGGLEKSFGFRVAPLTHLF